MEFRIIPPPDLSKEIAFYEKWLEIGYNGEMEYLKRGLEKRRTFPEWVKSILVVRASYNDINWDGVEVEGKVMISKYAIRMDYHRVLKTHIAEFLSELESKHKGIAYKIFVDSSPVLEKPIAKNAGFGFIGYNTLLLDPERGSYFNLGGAFLSVDLSDSIGNIDTTSCLGCNLCIESCPTKALVKPGVLDASKCISYLTVEYKGVIPKDLAVRMESWVFGCDVCQEVCPLNKKAKLTEVYSPYKKELVAPSVEYLLSLDEEGFRRLFDNTPVLRTGYARFLRNVIVAAFNLGYHKLLYNMYKSGKLQKERLWILQLKELGVLNEHRDY
jgi:epoxyqueuosine reductase